MTGLRFSFWRQPTLNQVGAVFLTAVLSAPVVAEDGGPIRFGARTDVPPMAYEDDDGKLRGYAIDICDEVKKTFAELFPDRKIEDDYLRVTAGDRQRKLLAGEVDTICGAFSVTDSRLKSFDYSFFIFVSGAGVAAVRKDDSLLPRPGALPAESAPRVAVLSDTTTRELVESLMGTSVTIEPKDTHTQAFKALVDGEVDYYIGDKVILQAMVSRSNSPEQFVVGGRFLSYEPYAMPFAKNRNGDLRYAANLTIAKLYRSERIFGIYRRHFDGDAPNEVLQSLYRLYAIPE